MASGAARVAHIDGGDNPADVFTKILAKKKVPVYREINRHRCEYK